MNQASIGVIGGSGLYQMTGLENIQEIKLNTPFGAPSDAIVMGTLEGKRVAFLPRHARGFLCLSRRLVRAGVLPGRRAHAQLRVGRGARVGAAAHAPAWRSQRRPRGFARPGR